MRRNLTTIALLVQTLFYATGVIVFISLILWGFASDARMRARSERMQKEHDAFRLLLDDTLHERARR